MTALLLIPNVAFRIQRKRSVLPGGTWPETPRAADFLACLTPQAKMPDSGVNAPSPMKTLILRELAKVRKLCSGVIRVTDTLANKFFPGLGEAGKNGGPGLWQGPAVKNTQATLQLAPCHLLTCMHLTCYQKTM